MDPKLTLAVKTNAYELGADLVGIANIERFSNAPVKMSPQGILPNARSVIVCAIHHPDAVIELDGEKHSQDMGPYRIQYAMNEKLDVISFKIGRMLQDLGHKTVPIASSNIWRYRGYKELTAVFSPDMSHIYAAVCAGLGELGWNGLCLTPEYGARNRFISIITEAELTPTPLYNGEKLCDMCGECIKHCPADAYRKEVSEVKTITVEDKVHRFCNKNLWRCAWGEHFDIDLDLPIPDVVDEEVLLKNIKDHGMRGGEFGVCLKVCLPKNLRQKDESYNKIGTRRKRHVTQSDLPVHRSVYDKILMHANSWNLDSVHFISQETLQKSGIDISAEMPDGISAILFTAIYPEQIGALKKSVHSDHYSFGHILQLALSFVELDTCRELEKLGYSALPKVRMPHDKICSLCGIRNEKGYILETSLIFTSAPFLDLTQKLFSKIEKPENLKAALETFSRQCGADLFGIAAASTIDDLAGQLRVIRVNEKLFGAEDKNSRFMPYNAVITEKKREIFGATDIMPDAKSVILIGIHYPDTAVLRAGQPPAEAVGPYVFTQYEVNRLIGHAGYKIVRMLQSMGFKAHMDYNLTGAGSYVGSPRGLFQDAACNALEAVAAGLGRIAYNGTVETNKYGIHQRFIAVITDAELTPDEVQDGEAPACAGCKCCLTACPTGALREEAIVTLNIVGKKMRYLPVDANRCDWASKYALVNEEGNMYIGNNTNVPCPDEITAEKLKAALETHDSVGKYRPVTAERCIIECPLIK